jgi:hypothetical protein
MGQSSPIQQDSSRTYRRLTDRDLDLDDREPLEDRRLCLEEDERRRDLKPTMNQFLRFDFAERYHFLIMIMSSITLRIKNGLHWKSEI